MIAGYKILRCSSCYKTHYVKEEIKFHLCECGELVEDKNFKGGEVEDGRAD